MQHYYGPEDRCMNCDCRPWGKWASLPCGASLDAPFIPVNLEKEWDDFIRNARVWAEIQDVYSKKEN